MIQGWAGTVDQGAAGYKVKGGKGGEGVQGAG